MVGHTHCGLGRRHCPVLARATCHRGDARNRWNLSRRCDEGEEQFGGRGSTRFGACSPACGSESSQAPSGRGRRGARYVALEEERIGIATSLNAAGPKWKQAQIQRGHVGCRSLTFRSL